MLRAATSRLSFARVQHGAGVARAFSTPGSSSEPARRFTLDEVDALVAKHPAYPISIVSLYQSALDVTPQQSLLNAQWLHREVIARRARMLGMLLRMPETLRNDAGVAALTERYHFRLDTHVRKFSTPRTEDDELAFEAHLRETVPRQEGETRRAIGGALAGLKPRTSNIMSRTQQRLIDQSVDAFFSERVGLRFLVDHYLASKQPREGFSGIIEKCCSPAAVCEAAAAVATSKVTKMFGVCPSIEVVGRRDAPLSEVTFAYVPEHLRFVVGELLHNACKWTVRHHLPEADEAAAAAGYDMPPGAASANDLPPVRAVAARPARAAPRPARSTAVRRARTRPARAPSPHPSGRCASSSSSGIRTSRSRWPTRAAAFRARACATSGRTTTRARGGRRPGWGSACHSRGSTQSTLGARCI